MIKRLTLLKLAILTSFACTVYIATGQPVAKQGNQWIVYFDKYTQHQYGAITSSDLVNWTEISDRLELPKGIRHGTVLPITKNELDKLLR